MKMKFEATKPYGNNWKFETEGDCVSSCGECEIGGVAINEHYATFILTDVPERIDMIRNFHVILMGKSRATQETEPHKILPSDISKTIYQREKVTA